ncbi:MAG: ABC transporter ATP-binding protein/permease [Bifidobacteriaceae bacterium]|nr:ABC transporter ATP-binding protein/permease [Bifidobacteriaceae bacterium]
MTAPPPDDPGSAPFDAGGPLIRLRAVGKRVGRKREVAALRHVDLDVWPGEFVAVTGPSGSGKSTLLAILGLLDAPTEGTYWFDGTDVAALSEPERNRFRGRQLGFVFQSSYLIGEDTAVVNTGLALRVRGVRARERDRLARGALTTLGLEDRASTRAKRLSGGERQRVALARALVAEPRLVLADEPTGALDTGSAAGLIAQLRAAADAGTTVVVVTHDPVVAAAADRSVTLTDGTLTGTAPPVASSPASPRPPSAPTSRLACWTAEAADAARCVIDTSVRSVLLLLAYTLGVAALVGASGLTQSASGAVAARLLDSASNALYVGRSSPPEGGSGGFGDLTGAAAVIEGLDGVEVAAPYLSYAPADLEVRRLAPSAVTWPAELRSEAVVCDSRYPARLGAEVAAGGPLTLLDNSWGGLLAVLGAQAAESLGVADAGPGVTVWVNQHAVPVAAVLAGSGVEALDNAVLLSPPTADLLGSPISATVLVGAAPGRAEALRDAIPLTLAPANPGGIEVSVASDLASLQASVASSLTGLMNTLGWVVLALAAMSAATSMLLSIHQRAPEIALRRAVGASRLAIWRGFMVEGALVGLAGGLIGALAGVAGTIWMAQARGWAPAVGLRLPLTAVALGLATAILAAALPAVHAARRDPAALLRGT